MADEALGGVGGAAGKKKDGREATVDYIQHISALAEVFTTRNIAAHKR